MRGRSFGLVASITASFTFGLSGPVLKTVVEAGWSPAAAVGLRVTIAALVLLPVTLLLMRGRWGRLWAARAQVLALGVVGVAASQFCYIAAVQRLQVGTAILLEYLAPVALVAWAWARTRRSPARIVLLGAGVSLAGLVLVVGPGAATAPDAIGLALALGAMASCAVYYLIAAKPVPGVHPVALAGVSLLVGSAALGVGGLVGLLPLHLTTADVLLYGNTVPVWLPLAIAGVAATAVPYVCSITGSAILGSRLASFLGLLEVVAATLYAWLLLGERLTWLQLAGGALILAGIACVHADPGDDGARARESRDPAEPLTTRPALSALTDEACGSPDPLGIRRGQ
ncbi:DMT family transporter [Propionicicella superfundia]|uniref:DMT family transporter n=1 Tax=Propionicicella superfundia TaxID=348582 RepID=UPI0003F6F2B4|nr:DMT family transporter [Propionicicella superfundia]